MNESTTNTEIKERILPLSRRELEILTLLGNGHRKRHIAERLGISSSTVATHAKNIYHKLGVINAAGAVGRAYRCGILTLD